MGESDSAGGEGTDTAAAPLMSAEELVARLGDPRLRVIDASFELSDPGAGPRIHAEGHVPGAVYLDLDRDLSSPPGEGGRHPLPDLEALARRLGGAGIGADHAIVVYDQSGTMYAARAWWLLRLMGATDVRFLDGGFAAYVAAGGPVADDTAPHPPTDFELRPVRDMAISADELLGKLGSPGVVVLDARSPERYRGEVEPIDPVAGHVPGALNRPYTASVGSGGLMLPPAELSDVHRVDELAGADEVIVYCGSGVSAAHLALALETAGLPGVRLYPGSWSEWTRRGLPVETGSEAVR